jgi:hypothetical protein
MCQASSCEAADDATRTLLGLSLGCRRQRWGVRPKAHCTLRLSSCQLFGRRWRGARRGRLRCRAATESAQNACVRVAVAARDTVGRSYLLSISASLTCGGAAAGKVASAGHPHGQQHAVAAPSLLRTCAACVGDRALGGRSAGGGYCERQPASSSLVLDTCGAQSNPHAGLHIRVVQCIHSPTALLGLV